MVKKNTKLFACAFLAPAFLFYGLFVITPMLMSFYYSLTQWDGSTQKVFVGFSNYLSMLSERDYWITFSNTIKLVFVSLLVQITLGLIVAYLVYRCKRGSKLFRTIFFLPVVIAPVAVGLMFSLFYNSEIGIFNKLLSGLGLGFLQRQWLSDVKLVLYSVMLPQVWQYIGLYMMIFYAAMQSVPQEIIESAQIDGAGSFKILTKIILPSIWGFMGTCVILCITGSLKSFDHPWIMTNGGPGVWSSYLGVYMYKTAFMNSDFGMGSTIAVSIVVISLIFLLLFNLLFKRKNSL